MFKTKKKKYLLYKLVKASWKFTILNSFMVQFFVITCVCTHISLKNKPYSHILEAQSKKNNKVHRQVGNYKNDFLGILDNCM